jgi:hypothetical protein
VVIGTRLIQEIDAAGPAHAVERAGAFISGIRQAMDSPAALPAQAEARP